MPSIINHQENVIKTTIRHCYQRWVIGSRCEKELKMDTKVVHFRSLFENKSLKKRESIYSRVEHRQTEVSFTENTKRSFFFVKKVEYLLSGNRFQRNRWSFPGVQAFSTLMLSRGVLSYIWFSLELSWWEVWFLWFNGHGVWFLPC